jgi:predicted ATPase
MHYDQALALYDPVEHRSLAMRFGFDPRAAILSGRSWVLWLLGHPERALADAEEALSGARAMAHVPTLLWVLSTIEKLYFFSGNYAAANASLNELATLAEAKGAFAWRTGEITGRGRLFALTGKSSEAIQLLMSGLADAAQRSTGATLYKPFNLYCLAHAHADLGQFDNARRCISEAMIAIESTNERWCQAEVYRAAGEIALKLPEPDQAKANAEFERALKVAHHQQAKSWELRAATSMARLWRDQGKPRQAFELLAPIYKWFSEGFNTRDLIEAEALLDTLTF